MQRFVQLYSWWVTPNRTRQFCLVEKTGKHFDQKAAGGTISIYRTTDVKLLEHLNPNPVNYEIDKFWDLVDSGKLIEYIPGVTELEGVLEATMQKALIETSFLWDDAA